MAIKSMTGYGAARFAVGGGTYRVEIRAVNHRHLDTKPHLPRELMPLESQLRERVGEFVRRGHVDVFVSREGSAVDGATELKVDAGLAERVRSALEQVRIAAGLQEQVGLGHILSIDGVVTTVPTEPDLNACWSGLAAGLDEALEDLDAMRRVEGRKLADDLLARARGVRLLVETVEMELPRLEADHDQRLAARLDKLTGHRDTTWREERLEAEMALILERSDVSEEIVRLRAHLDALEKLLTDGGEKRRGRKLEFLAVELNRELNTIASKASDAAIGLHMVDAKAEVERIREQAANVE